MLSQHIKSTFNYVQVIGRLCATPQKDITKKGILKTCILIKTEANTMIPFRMYGEVVDIVCTKFKIGDVVVATGKIRSSSSKKGKLKFRFYCTELTLGSRGTVELPNEDRFKKIVELYSPQSIDKRL